MSDKNFGDYANRNVVKNPLLSSAVVGLSLEELGSRAVLLPAAPQPSLVISQDAQPSIQTPTEPHNLYPNQTPKNEPPKPIVTPKTDNFDVNEYFARLQGTRYVSAPFNTVPNESLAANEENLEEVNLGDNPEENIEQHSLTSDIAQNFSQLPNVLPQMASAMFSSFSNMLKTKKDTVDEAVMKDDGFQKVECVSVEPVMKELMPPPKEPPIGCTSNTFRITTKRKTYAPIPGLSSNQTPAAPLPTLPPTHETHYFNPNNTFNVTQNENVPSIDTPSNTDVLDAMASINKPIEASSVNAVSVRERHAEVLKDVLQQQETNLVKDNVNFKPAHADISGNVFGSNVTHNFNMQTPNLQAAASHNVNVNIASHPSPFDNPPAYGQSDKSFVCPPVANIASVNQDMNTSIIPPPTMFSASPKKEPASIEKTILPPSVAKRLGRYQTGAKPVTSTPIFGANIFVPAPVGDVASTDDSERKMQPPPMFVNTSSPQVFTVEPSKNIFTPNVKTATESLATTVYPQMQDKPPIGMPLSISDPLSAPTDSAVITSSNQPSVSIQSHTEGFNPIQFTQTQIPLFKPQEVINPMETPKPMYDPAIITQRVVESPKPVPEPPKMATGSANYRLTKKRPQYYSGPIEGVGSISNNVKPVINAIDSTCNPTNFQAALFTPQVVSGNVIPENVNESLTFPSQTVIGDSQTFVMQQAIPQAQSEQSTQYNYDYNQQNIGTDTVYDFSRQTTEYLEQTKPENKGFGIIGSLKSKLGALDINKIQNTVTTFFDPAYNEVVKPESDQNKTTSYESYGQDIPQNTGGHDKLEIYVPTIETADHNQHFYNPQPPNYQSQFSTYFENINYPNQGHYKTQEAQYQEQRDYTGSYYTQDVGHNYDMIQQSSSGNNYDDKTVKEIANQSIASTPPQTVEISQQSNNLAVNEINTQMYVTDQQQNILLTQNTIENIHSIELPQEVNKDLNPVAGTLQQEAVASKSFDQNVAVKMLDPMEFFNQYHKTTECSNENASALEAHSQTYIEPSTSNLNDVKGIVSIDTDENSANTSDTFPKVPSLTASGFFNKDEEESTDSFVPNKNGYDPSTSSHHRAADVHSASLSNFTESFETTKHRAEEEFASSFNISSVPLVGLSSLIAEKSKDIEESISSMSLMSSTVSQNLEDITDKQSTSNNQRVDIEHSKTDVDQVEDIDICETCREVSKDDDIVANEQVTDLTSKLIENITSPIQLSNPVEVPLPEATDDTALPLIFDPNQYIEISKITEITKEAMQIQSTIDLFDSNRDKSIEETLQMIADVNKPVASTYGWSQTIETKQDVNLGYDHNYSFQPNPNAIGFYGDNSVFFDDISKNPNDQIKAEFKDSFIDAAHIAPTAPSAADVEDSTSDVTGILDVHLIEQDAKTDFSFIEEFVVEPDDSKIDKEIIPEEPELDFSTFTERVEGYKKQDNADDVFDKHAVENRPKMVLRGDYTSPTTMASYFDTGNYAAESHFRKSMTSPSSAGSFDVGSPKNDSAIPTISTIPTIIPPIKKDVETNQVPLTKGIFTLETLSTSHATNTKALTLQDDSIPVNISSQSFTANNPMTNIFPDLVRDTKQSGDGFQELTAPEFHAILSPISEASIATDVDTNTPHVHRNKDKMETMETQTGNLQAVSQQQKLQDPHDFFSTPHETKVEQTESSFNRLASYFAAPPKTEQSKNFFELSQSQDHLRQNQDSNKKVFKTFFELSQGTSQPVDFDAGNINKDIATQDKVIPFNLFKELTSVDNYTPSKDQTTKQVNYFTVEYDFSKDSINRDRNIGEPDAKACCSKNCDSKTNCVTETDNSQINNKINSNLTDLSKDSELKQNDDIKNYNFKTTNNENFNSETDKNNIKTNQIENPIKKHSLTDAEIDIIKAYDMCNLFSIEDDKTSVVDSNNIKVKQAMDKAGDGKGGLFTFVDNVTESKKLLSFEIIKDNKEEENSTSIAVENRNPSDYTPVKCHWFYRVDCDGKSLWRGFSHVDSEALENAHDSPDLNENTVVATDGGRFDVNIMGRLRIAVYWHEKPTNVRRCSWFYKGTTDARYVPYTEHIAEKLEEEYRQGITQGVWHRRLALANDEAVVMHTPSVMVHLLHANGSDSWPPHRQATMRPRVVRRGVDESEIEDTEPSRIDHLLLLCHGVGSACDMKFRSVEQVVEEFRSTSVQLIQSHYKSSFDKGDIGRIEVLPIAWHASLHAGERGVDKRLELITLDSIPLVRSFTNDAVLDVLFYTSPTYCQTILDTVCAELNRIYLLFKSRNPDFYGGVSVGGHSLGSVILYDLLMHQPPSAPSRTDTSDQNYATGTAGTGQPVVRYPELVFHPDAFYALGSPIAIFECIRGVDSLGEDYALPTCSKFFNIFHPYDPIAYRIEPLINPNMKLVPPSLIPHHKGRKRMHLELKETMARVGADLKHKLLESIKQTWSSMWRTDVTTQKRLEMVVEEEIEKEALNQEEIKEVAVNIEAPPEIIPAATPGRLNSGRRVDHVLQEAPLEMINEYLFAMSSHVCYWESEDCMLLILREIYDALGVHPDCTVPQPTLTVQRDGNSTPSDQSQDLSASADFPSTSSS